MRTAFVRDSSSKRASRLCGCVRIDFVLSTVMASKRKRDDEGCNSPKYRRQTFKKEYVKDFPSFQKSKKGEYFAYCTACRKDINISHGGRYDCKKHVETEAHKTAEKSSKGQKPIVFVKAFILCNI